MKYKLHLGAGDRYGRYTVLKVDETSKRDTDGKRLTPAFWKYVCLCDCGAEKSVHRKHLVTGDTVSCGCYHEERRVECRSKQNRISEDTDGVLKIFFFNTERYTLIDKEDYNSVSHFCWLESSNGYAYARTHGTGEKVRLHRFLLGFPSKSIDHINGNPLDNRRLNLRECSNAENMRNQKKRRGTNNKHVGVRQLPKTGKWQASITYRYKTIYLGSFETYEEAVNARLLAEQEYFGEFAPKIHTEEERIELERVSSRL